MATKAENDKETKETKATKETKEGAAEYTELTFPDTEEGVEHHTERWQLYRSRMQFRAIQPDSPFKVGGVKGEPGDFVVYRGDDEYEVVAAEEMADYQPITPTERAKT